MGLAPDIPVLWPPFSKDSTWLQQRRCAPVRGEAPALYGNLSVLVLQHEVQWTQEAAQVCMVIETVEHDFVLVSRERRERSQTIEFNCMAPRCRCS